MRSILSTLERRQDDVTNGFVGQRADILRPNDPFAVDDESLGRAGKAPVDTDGAVTVIVDLAEGIAELSEKGTRFPAVVLVDEAVEPDARALGELVEHGGLQAAGRAPGRPEIHDGRFSLAKFVIGKGRRVLVEGHRFKLRRRLADKGRRQDGGSAVEEAD